MGEAARASFHQLTVFSMYVMSNSLEVGCVGKLDMPCAEAESNAESFGYDLDAITFAYVI